MRGGGAHLVLGRPVHVRVEGSERIHKRTVVAVTGGAYAHISLTIVFA